MATISAISIFVSFYVIRQCELIHGESKSFVQELQSEAARIVTKSIFILMTRGQTVVGQNNMMARGFHVYRRSFRRKRLVAKVWMFSVGGAGFGMNFLSMVVDNVVSLVLVVDTRYPLILVLTEGVGCQRAPTTASFRASKAW